MQISKKKRKGENHESPVGNFERLILRSFRSLVFAPHIVIVYHSYTKVKLIPKATQNKEVVILGEPIKRSKLTQKMADRMARVFRNFKAIYNVKRRKPIGCILRLSSTHIMLTILKQTDRRLQRELDKNAIFKFFHYFFFNFFAQQGRTLALLERLLWRCYGAQFQRKSFYPTSIILVWVDHLMQRNC